jgi:hypothetical protein
MSEFEQGGEQLSPREKRERIIAHNVAELARRHEAGEIGEDFGPEAIWYLQQDGQPITKKAVGNSAVVLSQEEFEQLGYIDMVKSNGELITIESEVTGYQPEQLFITFPEELGDIENE